MTWRIECAELYELLEDEELLVVDCRHDDDWQQLPRHIPGALRMSVIDLFQLAHVLPDDEFIVLVGTSERSDDSELARRILQRRGREAVCLQGGLEAWLQAGLPTELHGLDADRPWT